MSALGYLLLITSVAMFGAIVGGAALVTEAAVILSLWGWRRFAVR